MEENTSKPRSSSKKFVVAALALVLALAVGAGVGYMLPHGSDSNSNSTSTVALPTTPDPSITFLTPANYQTELSAATPIVVVVCTPDICQMEQAAINKIAKAQAGHVKFLIIDAKAQQQVAGQFLSVLSQMVGSPISSFPVFVGLDKDGNPVGLNVGLLTDASIGQLADAALNPPAQPASGTPGASGTPAPATPTK